MDRRVFLASVLGIPVASQVIKSTQLYIHTEEGPKTWEEVYESEGPPTLLTKEVGPHPDPEVCRYQILTYSDGTCLLHHNMWDGEIRFIRRWSNV